MKVAKIGLDKVIERFNINKLKNKINEVNNYE